MVVLLIFILYNIRYENEIYILYIVKLSGIHFQLIKFLHQQRSRRIFIDYVLNEIVINEFEHSRKHMFS